MTLHEAIYKRLQDIDNEMRGEGLFPEYVGLPSFSEYMELVKPLHEALLNLSKQLTFEPIRTPGCDTLEQGQQLLNTYVTPEGITHKKIRNESPNYYDEDFGM